MKDDFLSQNNLEKLFKENFGSETVIQKLNEFVNKNQNNAKFKKELKINLISIIYNYYEDSFYEFAKNQNLTGAGKICMTKIDNANNIIKWIHENLILDINEIKSIYKLLLKNLKELPVNNNNISEIFGITNSGAEIMDKYLLNLWRNLEPDSAPSDPTDKKGIMDSNWFWNLITFMIVVIGIVFIVFLFKWIDGDFDKKGPNPCDCFENILNKNNTNYNYELGEECDSWQEDLSYSELESWLYEITLCEAEKYLKERNNYMLE